MLYAAYMAKTVCVCFFVASTQDYLGIIFRDELISWHPTHHHTWLMSKMSNETLIEKVDINVKKMKDNLGKLAQFDGTNSNVDNLIKDVRIGTKGAGCTK